jgi:hypothetical protein
VVATHGRSFWVLDDITPLRQINEKVANAELFLWVPQTAYRLHYPDEMDTRRPVGENPPPGAILNYYLLTSPKGEVTLQISDSQGKPVRTLSSVQKKEDEQPPEWPDQVKEMKTIPAAEGMNRYVWNLRYDDPIKVPGAFYSGVEPRGPLVLPGRYQVQLTAEGRTQTVILDVLPDPRVKVVPGDLEKQAALAGEIYRSVNRLHAAINQIRDLKAQIQALRKRLEDDLRLKPLLASSEELEKKLSLVEEELIQVNMKGSEANLAFPNMLNEQFDTFAASVESADAAPTQQQYEVYKTLSGRLEEQLKKLNGVLNAELAAFVESLKRSNIPLIVVPKTLSH